MNAFLSKRFAATLVNTQNVSQSQWLEAVKSAVCSHVECTGKQWQQVHFSNPALKFRVINDALLATKVPMSNVELTNIKNSVDLMDFVKKKYEPTGIDSFMEDLNVCNVSFVPKPAPVVVKKTIADKVYKKNWIGKRR